LIDKIKSIDESLFLALNEIHSQFFDFIFFWASNKYIWIPLYLILLFLLYKNYKKETLFITFTLIALIATSDLISVHCFKNVFMRLRPCHEPSLQGLVHIVNNKCGGSFGFYSSHASNHFALAVMLNHFLKPHYKYFTVLIFPWAAIISYSRIYLGVHYPGDVISGAIMGIFLGWVCYKLYLLLKQRIIKS